MSDESIDSVTEVQELQPRRRPRLPAMGEPAASGDWEAEVEQQATQDWMKREQVQAQRAAAKPVKEPTAPKPVDPFAEPPELKTARAFSSRLREVDKIKARAVEDFDAKHSALLPLNVDGAIDNSDIEKAKADAQDQVGVIRGALTPSVSGEPTAKALKARNALEDFLKSAQAAGADIQSVDDLPAWRESLRQQRTRLSADQAAVSARRAQAEKLYGDRLTAFYGARDVDGIDPITAPKQAAETALTSAVQAIAPVTGAKPAPDTSFVTAFKTGLAKPAQGMGATLNVAGVMTDNATMANLGAELEAFGSDPANYESAGGKFSETFNPKYLPRAVVEQVGQLAGSILSRVVGAAIGGAVGSAGGSAVPVAGTAAGGLTGVAAGAFIGPAVFEAAQLVGPVARERAKNDGRTEITREDLAYALGTAAASGSLNSIGAKYLPGGEQATGTFVKKLMGAIISEGVTEGGQSLVEQTGGSVATAAGTQVNLRDAAAEGIIGAATGGAATAVGAVIPSKPAPPATSTSSTTPPAPIKAPEVTTAPAAEGDDTFSPELDPELQTELAQSPAGMDAVQAAETEDAQATPTPGSSSPLQEPTGGAGSAPNEVAGAETVPVPASKPISQEPPVGDVAAPPVTPPAQKPTPERSTPPPASNTQEPSSATGDKAQGVARGDTEAGKAPAPVSTPAPDFTADSDTALANKAKMIRVQLGKKDAKPETRAKNEAKLTAIEAEQKRRYPRETIEQAKDTVIGKNRAGETIYGRADGSYYRMRNDRADRPNSYPDFGGDLSPVEPPADAPRAQTVPESAALATDSAPSGDAAVATGATVPTPSQPPASESDKAQAQPTSTPEPAQGAGTASAPRYSVQEEGGKIFISDRERPWAQIGQSRRNTKGNRTLLQKIASEYESGKRSKVPDPQIGEAPTPPAQPASKAPVSDARPADVDVSQPPSGESQPAKASTDSEQAETATLTFSTYEAAKEFATKWTRATFEGTVGGKRRPDGSAQVTVYKVTPERKRLIEELTGTAPANLKKTPDSEVTPPAKSEAATPAPLIPRGQSTPAEFIKSIAKATGLTGTSDAARALIDFAGRLHRAAPQGFADMETYVLTEEEWAAFTKTEERKKLRSSTGVYVPSENKLYIRKDKMRDANALADMLFHEAGHFAEMFAINSKVVDAEWAKLKQDDGKIEQAVGDYYPEETRSGARIRAEWKAKPETEWRAKREWVAQQFARVVARKANNVPPGIRAELQKFWDSMKQFALKFLGSDAASSPVFDAEVLRVMGFNEDSNPEPRADPEPTPNGVTTPAVADTTPRVTPTRNPSKFKVSDDLRKGIDDLLGTPAERPTYAKWNGSSLVDSRRVINENDIPNRSSISASLNNYRVLPGIRVIPISDFTLSGRSYSVAGQNRIDNLAKRISESGEITPLIVAIDDQGPYILEGATRADALAKIGAKEFPALVVEELPDTLGTPPEPPPVFNKKFGAKITAANNVIGMIVRDNPQITSRAALGEFIAEVEPRLKPFSEALFSILSGAVDTVNDGPSDWNAIYAPATPEVAPATPKVAKAKKSGNKPRFSYATNEAGFDLLDAIREAGGVPRPPKDAKGGEWDNWKVTFGGGSARLLVGNKVGGITEWLQDDLAPLTSRLYEIEEFYNAIQPAIDARNTAKERESKAQRQEKFYAAALENKGRSFAEPKGEASNTSVLTGNSKFDVKGEPFRVVDFEETDDGYAVIAQDGDRFGTVTLPPATVFYPDAGTLDIGTSGIDADFEAATATPALELREPTEAEKAAAAEAKRKREQAEAITEKADAPIKGDAGDQTRDMFGGGDMALFDSAQPPATLPPSPSSNEPSANPNLERDRGDSAAQDGGRAPRVRPERAGDAANDGGVGERVSERANEDSSGDSAGVPAVGREGGDSILPERRPGAVGPGASIDGGEQSSGGGATRGPRIVDVAGADAAVDYVAAKRPSVDRVAGERESTLADRIARQRLAETVHVIDLDPANIAETLPVLLPDQHDDVLKAERRFYEAKAKGILFTNGTGTGKTYTGLGIIKRFVRKGARDVLIVVPSSKKAMDWREDGERLGLDIGILEGIADAGSGINVTTYANFRTNEPLAARDFDLVVYDESHKLMENAEGERTSGTQRHQFITNHESAVVEKVAERVVGQKRPRAWEYPKGRFEDYQRDYAAWDARAREKTAQISAEVARIKDKTRVVFLSATPFAYHKTLGYADGYLFRSPERTDKNRRTGYNEPQGFDRFLVENFGYRMRTGKLTAPEAEVNMDLMERAFADRLMKEGAMSGRSIDVPFDYSREFVLLDAGLGAEIDRGLGVLRGWIDRDQNGFKYLEGIARKRFDYIYTMQLLESVKVAQSIGRIRQHIASGRKVILFHDYNNANPQHPFNGLKALAADDKGFVNENAVKEIETFEARYPELVNLDVGILRNPLALLADVFGTQAVFFNGTVSAGKRQKNVTAFNDDASPVKLLVAQSDAMAEGVSAHDTTGKHQRVVMNVGLPVKPTKAIQEEGRAYRVGVKSNAVYEYVVIHTGSEKYAFGSKINLRVRTAENLALGSQARALQDSFKQGYLNPITAAPSETQGRGGKDADRRAATISEFDRAKTLYFGRQKKTQRTKSAEGVDYFATPEPIGMKMVEWAQARPNEKMLEPSAGHGAIASFFPISTKNTYVEPSLELAEELRIKVSSGETIVGTFEDLNVVNKFDAIVLNPPFGQGGSTAMKHLTKAAMHLRDGGRIIALIPEGGSADAKFDKWYEGSSTNFIKVGEYGLPNVVFERAGADVKTRIVVIDRIDDQDRRSESVTRQRVDISGGTIGEVFERIEQLSVPARQSPEETAAAPLSSRNAVLPVASTPKPAQTPSKASGKFETAEFPHTKNKKTVFVAKTGKLSDEEYKKASATARRYGGYYSSFKGMGAIPGLHFPTKQARVDFLTDMASSAALGTPAERTELNPPKNAEVPGTDGRERYRSHTDTLIERGYQAVDRLPYKVMTDAYAKDAAAAFIEAAGEATAMTSVFDTQLNLPEKVKTAIGAQIITRLSARAFNPDLNEIQRTEAAAQFASFRKLFAERGTELGQGAQAYNMIDHFSVNGAFMSAGQQATTRQDTMLGADGIKAEEEIVDALNGENGKVIDQLLKDVKADVRKVKVTRKMVERTVGDLPKNKKELDAAIKKAFEDTNRRVSNILHTHHTQADAIGSNLVDKLTQEAGLSQAEAEKLAEAVRLRLTALTETAKRKVLARLERDKSAIARRVFSKTIIDKVVDMSNSGAIDQPALRERVAEELKLPRITDATAKRLKDLTDKYQRTPEGQFRDRIATDILAEMRKLKGIGPVDIATAIYYSHILSGYTTQLINILSTAFNVSADLANEVLRAEARAMFTRNGGKVGTATGQALVGMFDGARMGFTIARSILDTGYAKRAFDAKLPEVSPILEILSKEPAASKAGTALKGYALVLRYITRLMRASDAVFYRSASEAFQRVAAAKIVGARGAMTREETNSKIRDLMNTSPAQFDAAEAQAKSEGFTGYELGLRTGEILEQGRAKGLVQTGDRKALEATFNNTPRGALGTIAKHVREIAQAIPALKLFVPFTDIVANVTNASLNYSPLGFVRAARGYAGEVDMTQKQRADAGIPDLRDERAALAVKAFAGTAAMVALLAYALSGEDDDEAVPLITARGSRDPNRNRQLRESGWAPHTIRIGGQRVSYLSSFMAVPLAFVGNIADGIRYNDLAKHDYVSAFIQGTVGIGSTLTEMSFLQGIADLFDTLRGKEGKTPERFAANVASSALVPNLLKQVDRTFDDTYRKGEGFMGEVAATIPVLRQSQPAMLTNTGKEVQSQPLTRFGRPETGDPLWDVLNAKGVVLSELKSKKIGNRQATPEELRAILVESGPRIEKRLRSALPLLRSAKAEPAEKLVQRIALEERDRAAAMLPQLMRR